MSTALTKADTAALWSAIDWMRTGLLGWEGDLQPEDKAAFLTQKATLKQAKAALRKVNELQRQGL